MSVFLRCSNRLFKIIVVAIVVPEDASKLMRYLIETLFSIRAETKLNMICPIGADPKRIYGPVYDRVWCRDLIPPPVNLP